MLVYQMRYTSEAPTAMILPLPVARGSSDASVQWTNLRPYPRFFSDLAAGFPAPVGGAEGRSRGASVAVAAAAPLPVHDVGDFVATFVPSVNDFDRVDPRFAIAKEVWAQIPSYEKYGFAVFQLANLSGTPHPIAFEFQTRLRDTLYFPTVHIHDGTVHAKDHFDHALYLQDARFDAKVSGYRGPDSIDEKTGYVRSANVASTFANVTAGANVIDGSLLAHRRTLRGMLPNADTFVQLPRSAHATGANDSSEPGPSLASGGLVGVGMLGLSWVIGRRNALRSRSLLFFDSR